MTGGRVALLRGRLQAARLTNLAEEDTDQTLAASPDGVSTPVPARAGVTVRLIPEPVALNHGT